MTKHDTTKKVGLRSRIEYEDGLLNSRTGIFLITNSLLGVAAEIKEDSVTNVVLVGFAIVICFLWIIVGFKHHRVIGELTRTYLKEIEETGGDFIEEIVQKASSIWLPLRPTNILSLWLPSLTLIAWIIIAFPGVP